MGKGTIVLAYSGGLDTSICIPLLKERYDYDRVVTVAVNVGQRDEEIDVATKKGEKTCRQALHHRCPGKVRQRAYLPGNPSERILRGISHGGHRLPAP